MSILRSFLLAAGLTLISAVPATAAISLPTVKRTLTAASASESCKGSSSATTTYNAPMAGFVTARLFAAGGEWDLYVADARSRKGMSQSRAFGSTEVSQTWVSAGQKLLISACRTAGSVSSATLTIGFADAAKPAKVTSSVIRTARVSQSEFDALTEAGFDMTEMTIAKDYMDIFIQSADQLAQFKKFGIDFKVRIADLAANDAKARAAEARRARMGVQGLVPSGRTTYRFLADYQAEMAKIVADHGVAAGKPGIAKAITIGSTYQGRSIQGIEFSQNVAATNDGKPTFFLLGNHHAREWPSSEVGMEFMHLLSQKYGAADAEGARITDILSKVRIIVVPILNIDGFVSSRGESAAQAQIGAIPDPEDTLETGIGQTGEALLLGGTLAYRRKNCNGSIPAAAVSNDAARGVPCTYAHGVDPNRNYGFDWGGPGASNDPFTQVYRGTGQWSEPETQAVWHTSQNRPVTVLVTMHTIAALVLRSPGLHTNGLAPDETLLKELGDKMGKLTGYTSQYGWQLYDTTGTTEDWNYGAVGTLGYTIEIGPKGGVFHGDYKVAVEDQWVGKQTGTKPNLGGMKESLLTAAAYAFDPKTHPIIRGNGPAGAELELKKTFNTDSSPICTFAQGFLVAGGPTEPVDCVAPGGAPGELGQTSTPDGLTYTTRVRDDGTFTWHITQSTRPFKGYTYDAATKKPKANATPRETWELTCTANGLFKKQTFAIERGEQLDLGDVCSV